MTLEEAKKFLADTTRGELRDHAFGDVEITWLKADGTDVAFGYFGSGEGGITVYPEGPRMADDPPPGKPMFEFKGREARELRQVGKLEVERNDMTGPDEFAEGQVMPGLRPEAVRAELTTPPAEE